MKKKVIITGIACSLLGVLYGLVIMAVQGLFGYGDLIRSLAIEREGASEELASIDAISNRTEYWLESMIANSASLSDISVSQSKLILTSGFLVVVFSLVSLVFCVKLYRASRLRVQAVDCGLAGKQSPD